MANNARCVVQANGMDHIVTVIQGAVEDVVLPEEEEDWDGVGLAQEEGDVELNDDGRKNQRVVGGYYPIRIKMDGFDAGLIGART
ncbi:hypothetical protein ACHAXH_002952 [Discostella pseudostelligera]